MKDSNYGTRLTPRIIKKMLTENTGTHFLDSGGYGRRHWQRNQPREFDNEPPTTLTFKWGYIEVTHNLYHWLTDRLEYNEKIDNLFYNEYAPTQDNDLSWLALTVGFPEWLRTRLELPVTGLYGDGEPFTVNTYNGEDLLSQVIQYLYMETDQEPVILLAIHGGCDVRGGYTKPKAFNVDEQRIFDNAHATIICPNGHYWYTDDANHWYFEGCAGLNAGKQLEEYQIVEPDEDAEPPAIFTNDNGDGYCPLCFTPNQVLTASSI